MLPPKRDQHCGETTSIQREDGRPQLGLSGSVKPMCKYNEKGAAAVTIRIHRPELEALIQERMKSGRFDDVEDVLMAALTSAPPRGEAATARSQETSRTGADLIAA